MSKKKIKTSRQENKARKAGAERKALFAQEAKRRLMMRDLKLLDDLDLLQFLPRPTAPHPAEAKEEQQS
jgi:hypothetical protein